MNIPFRRSFDGIAVAERLGELTRYSEVKRMVYTIATLQKQKRFRSLAVLSSFPAEGKTLISAALAIAYAETCGLKVLVVDATTRQNRKSLNLRDCLALSVPLIDFVSLQEDKRRPVAAERAPRDIIGRSISLETEAIQESSVAVSSVEESDQSIIRKITEDRNSQYGLVLLDTSPLSSQNRNNIDPLLVAHLSDASVLVVSRKLLDAANLDECTKVLEDPNLHLIGMISNEDHHS